MPLNRKWRSMDFFGSHESINKGLNPDEGKARRPVTFHEKADHQHRFSVKNPFRNRLASSGSRDQTAPGVESQESPDGGLKQKCIIIQKDEKGYGFTVSGDNPVFVASVKQDGAAARAGVHVGDRIIKVNGTLVTQRNHIEVVRLIKAGCYVALTLMGKPPATIINSQVSSVQPTVSSTRVTPPQPVNPDKDRELWQQKVHMTRTMFETAKEDFEKLQKQYVSRPSEKAHALLLEKERTVRALENQLKQLTGEDIPSPTSLTTMPVNFSHSEHNPLDHSSLPSWTTSLSTADTFDLDSPQDSPSVSPVLPDSSSGYSGQDVEDSGIPPTQIIHIDDEEVNSEDDQANDPGLFADIKLLEGRPGHMAVLLNYLISNSDPSPVLFHIISDLYCRSAASVKELRKWAYEIFSTFIYKRAPLSVSVEDNIISQIDRILASSGSKMDNENILRSMFHASRQSVQLEIADMLLDFRSKKDLGMGNLYGVQKVHANMDRLSEVRVAEELLMPHLKYFGVEDNSQRQVTDKDLATGWALATFLRSLGGSKSANNFMLDRMQTFMMKDKKSIKFPGTRSNRAKAVKGHQLTLQHFFVTTFCGQCQNLIWGVGYQGYQCQSCSINIHKKCADEMTEQCGRKQKQRNSSILSSGSVQSRRQPSTSSVTEQLLRLGIPGRVGEAQNVPQNDVQNKGQPKQDSSDLGTVLSIIAGIKPNDSQFLVHTTVVGSGQDSLGMSDQQRVDTSLANNNKHDRRGSSNLTRSGSLNNKVQKSDKPERRSNSDVTMDAGTFQAFSQSESSSASSLSNRSVESPGDSTDSVSDLLRAQQEDPDLDVEPELPTLKQVLPEEVLRKLKPKEKKRQEVINELIYTERAHLRNLKVLNLLFNQPMIQEKGIFMDLARALFPNMEEIVSYHETLVRSIKERCQTNAVVQNIGDILLKRFGGEAGDRFSQGCAEYCRNQVYALDALKKHTRKEPRLQQFLLDAESNPMCRRLQLKDLVPSQMQRLTKYPLLIDTLLKYTQSNSDEYKDLEVALDRCKHTLAYVNQAVKEIENYRRLREIHKKLDRKPVENLNDPALADLKTLDLTQHKLIFDGPLTWKLRNHRTVDMHVLLFEDILVLLQKQEDRFILKCHNTNAQPTRDDKYTHYPVLKLHNLLARMLATDKRSFFVVNISESRAQMYEFTAASAEMRNKWCKLINDRAEEFKKSQTQKVGIDRNRASRISRKGRSSSTVHVEHTIRPSEADIFEVTDQLQQNLDLADDSSSQVELILPGEVSVAHAVTAESLAVNSSLAGSSPGDTCQGDQFQQQVSVAASMEQCRNMATEMNIVLTKLAGSLTSDSQEQEHSTQKLDQELFTHQKQTICNVPVCSSVQSDNPSIDDMPVVTATEHTTSVTAIDDMPVVTATEHMTPVTAIDDMPVVTATEHTTSVTAIDDIPAAYSHLSSLQSQEMDILPEHLAQLSIRSSAIVDEEEHMHQGLQEATVTRLEESIEPFSMSSEELAMDVVPVVATEIRTIEREDNSATDDDDEVCVADLPLPDMARIDTSDMSARPLDVITVNTLTIRPDSSILATMLEDLDGEKREIDHNDGEKSEVEDGENLLEDTLCTTGNTGEHPATYLVTTYSDDGSSSVDPHLFGSQQV